MKILLYHQDKDLDYKEDAKCVKLIDSPAVPRIGETVLREDRPMVVTDVRYVFRSNKEPVIIVVVDTNYLDEKQQETNTCPPSPTPAP